MKKTGIIIAIVAVLAIIVLWGIRVNNRLVTADEGVQQADALGHPVIGRNFVTEYDEDDTAQQQGQIASLLGRYSLPQRFDETEEGEQK